MHTYVGPWVENRQPPPPYCLDSSETDNNHINQENTQQIWCCSPQLDVKHNDSKCDHETGTEQK